MHITQNFGIYVTSEMASPPLWVSTPLGAHDQISFTQKR